jgi:tetratricopeptide (TPR) repeat protein
MRTTRIFAAIALINLAFPMSADAEVQSRASSLHQRARILSQQGKWSEALKYELEASVIAPESALPHKGLSCIYSQLGDNARARKEAERAIALNPKDGDSHLNLATILQSFDQQLDALAEYELAARLLPGDLQPMQGQAQCLMALGRYSEACTLLESIAKTNPNNSPVLLNLALARSGMGNTSGAEQAAFRVLSIDERSYAATRILADIALENGRIYQAVPLAKKLILLEPKNRTGYLFLSQCLSELAGWPAEADKLTAQARRNLPGDAKLFQSLSATYNATAKRVKPRSNELAALRRGWWNASIHAMRAAVDADPKNVSYRLDLAKVLLKEKRYHEAAAQISSARLIDPANPQLKKLSRTTNSIVNDIAGELKWWLKQQASG